jgi:hypothetical protein
MVSPRAPALTDAAHPASAAAQGWRDVPRDDDRADAKKKMTQG